MNELNLNPKEVLNSPKAKKWYRDNIHTLTHNNMRRDLLSNSKNYATELQVGSMYMYIYSPETHERLPYWDVFPLTIILDYDNIGFLGLNIHYLPIKMRETLVNNMLDFVNNNKYDKTTRMDVTYKLLKSFSRYKYMKPCVKKYYYRNIKSGIIEVPPIEWAYSLYLPVEGFRGLTKEGVWLESERKI